MDSHFEGEQQHRKDIYLETVSMIEQLGERISAVENRLDELKLPEDDQLQLNDPELVRKAARAYLNSDTISDDEG